MSVSDTIMDGAAEVSSSALLQVRSLGKRYGDQHALLDISFDARACEVIGLIGPNGAGKTTLLETLAGVLPADQGELLWRGASLPQSRRREVMFYLPDGLRPWEDQYVARVLAFFANVYRRLAQHVSEVVRAVGLAPVLRKRVSALSKGFARRLMLALALLTPQPLLLMDEPFDGFDLRQTREIMGVIRQVAANGRTLVLRFINWQTPSGSPIASCCLPTESFEAGSTDDAYGQIEFLYGGRNDMPRSTSPREILPLLYTLAGREPPAPIAGADYAGYPLIADRRPALAWYFGGLPLLILTAWWLSRRPPRPSRIPALKEV